MNDPRIIEKYDIIEYSKDRYAQLSEVQYPSDIQTILTYPEVALNHWIFILNNGMHKTLKQIVAVYRKNSEGNLEKIFDKESFILWSKLI